MQVAYINFGTDHDFAVRRNESESWTALNKIGIHAKTTREVIEKWHEVESGAPREGVGDDEVDLLCPVVAPGKMLAIGLNYLDHIKETGAKQPDQPVVFAKYPSSLAGPTQDTAVDPNLTQELDYEAELAVIIGQQSRRLTLDNAMDSVFGYSVANDVSARDLQRTDAQFSRSKSFDSFCPIGPWITTADSVIDPQRLNITSKVNDEIRQDSSTEQMLFSIRELLVYLSSTMTLWPGDVILTGTPPGVGLGFAPPKFLKPGDIVECAVEGLGSIRNRVVLDPTAS